MHSRLFAILAVITLSTIPGAAEAVTITLGFDDLPSAQGWTYRAFNNTLPETQVFSVDGTTLFQDTLGSGLEVGSNSYERDGAVDPTSPFAISVTARVVETEENEVVSPLNGCGFCFGVVAGGGFRGIGLGADPNLVELTYPGGELDIVDVYDTTQFHDFRMRFVPGVQIDFFIDDVLVHTGPGIPATPATLVFGDRSGGANASAEMTFYQFVPEPTTALLLACGLTGLAAAGRRRSLR